MKIISLDFSIQTTKLKLAIRLLIIFQIPDKYKRLSFGDKTAF
ncbi:hypothetical protein C8C87_1280 [Flavobacterium sp. 120]|nr:hypothetical protein CLV00_2791 [Flavobacterium sp. 11]RKS14028.1 hypothetical protein C8C87_1280 [Flavobacterium sp. 120]